MALRTRLFVAYALLSLVVLGSVLAIVELRVRQQVLADTEARLRRTRLAFVEHWKDLLDRLGREAAIVADAPKLKAAVDTEDPATIAPVAEEYRWLIRADRLAVLGPEGAPLARSGAEAEGLFVEVRRPILLGPTLLGWLVAGTRIDEAFARAVERRVGAEVVVRRDGAVVASSLDGEDAPTLPSGEGELQRVLWRNEAFLAVRAPTPGIDGAEVVLLHSLDESLRILAAVRRDLLWTGLVALGLASLAGYLTARRLTRPLTTIVDGMRAMARSGDLTQRIRVAGGDEEATLLAETLNQLTRSLLAFRKRAEHKERLSSLGKLSATLAHEIRNPLTIIKGSALQLLEENAPPEEVREAANDILQEVDRLDALVASVLDSVRPAPFRIETAEIHELCRQAIEAFGHDPRLRIETDWDPTLLRVRVDPDRLRQVLWNLLRNARDAVGEGGTIRIETRRGEETYTIRVADDGVGIDPADLPRVFEPFFTRKDAGTGLGLAVARQIVDGLGGRIDVASAPGRGTVVTVTLPFAPKPAFVLDDASPVASDPGGVEGDR